MGHKRVIQRRNWKNKTGHENLFAGLLYCENEHKLSFCPQEKDGVNLDHYKCYHFKRAGDTCSGGHYLRKEVLENLILNELQELINSFQINEADLLQRLKDKYAHNIEKFITTIRKYTQLENLTSKIVNELIDKIIIHQPIGRGKNRQIKLEIHYRFIGDI